MNEFSLDAAKALCIKRPVYCAYIQIYYALEAYFYGSLEFGGSLFYLKISVGPKPLDTPSRGKNTQGPGRKIIETGREKHLPVTLGKLACQDLAEGVSDVWDITAEAWFGLSYSAACIHFLSERPGLPQRSCFSSEFSKTKIHCCLPQG